MLVSRFGCKINCVYYACLLCDCNYKIWSQTSWHCRLFLVHSKTSAAVSPTNATLAEKKRWHSTGVRNLHCYMSAQHIPWQRKSQSVHFAFDHQAEFCSFPTIFSDLLQMTPKHEMNWMHTIWVARAFVTFLVSFCPVHPHYHSKYLLKAKLYIFLEVILLRSSFCLFIDASASLP